MNNPTNTATWRLAKFASKWVAAFTYRNGSAFRLNHMGPSSTDIKPLQPAKRILLQHICEGVWVGCSKQGLMGCWCIRLELMKWWWHLNVLGVTWLRLWLMWKEGRWRIWNMMHSQIVSSIIVCHYFSSCNLEPLNFLLQCFI